MTTTKMLLCLALAGFALSGPARAAEPASTPAAAPDPATEIVCRKQPETGSLIKVRKTCHTRAQWRYLDDETRRVNNNFVDDNRGRTNVGN